MLLILLLLAVFALTGMFAVQAGNARPREELAGARGEVGGAARGAASVGGQP